MAHTAELEESLASRKLVDRAKGKLMAAGLSEEAAYQAIQQQARQNRQSMAEVAQDILGGDSGKTVKKTVD